MAAFLCYINVDDLVQVQQESILLFIDYIINKLYF